MTLTSLFLIFASLVGSCLSVPQYSGQGGSGPYTPVQSSFCATGQDCVPWQRCVDGYIIISEILGIDQRTQPANYNEFQCGDAGNMCCNIPNSNKPYEELDVCGHASYSCVPYFQCIDGEIVTDGTGLIDVRITPQGVCTNPDYPDVPGVCCLKPGYNPIPEPVKGGCTGIQECVAFEQCDVLGNIVTDGSGLIDIRTGFTSCTQPSGIRGRCCNPTPPYVDACPSGSTCVPGTDCIGQALDGSKSFIDYVTSGVWTSCSYGSGNGVCCKVPYIDACPSSSICTLPNNCKSQALDGYNNFVDYVSSGTWSFCNYGNENGVCCSVSSDYLRCPEPSICVPKGQCSGSAYSSDAFSVYPNTQISDWTACNAQGGICCASAAGQCGITNSKILPRITANIKNEALFGEFPWQAIIFDKSYVFICGAVLISNIHVLTAAHCVDEHTANQIQIRLGEYQVNSFDEPLPYSDHEVASVSIHKEFKANNLHNDIAVIVLAHPVPLQYHINTICLPDAGTVIPAYSECYVSGWGKDAFVDGQFQHILKKIKVPFVDYATCQDLLRKTRLGRFFQLDKSFVCAGGEENKDACYGDGGGPLVCKVPGHNGYVLAGITSWGIGCGTKNVPGVYANVQYFNSWVNNIVIPSGGQQTVPGYGK